MIPVADIVPAVTNAGPVVIIVARIAGLRRRCIARYCGVPDRFWHCDFDAVRSNEDKGHRSAVEVTGVFG